jgi:hypothetical protein
MFRDVSIELEIPPPEIKTVLSNATIVADDGVRGPVENKGDGFKRAITFSILRSYVQLSQDKSWRKDDEKAKPGRDRFLFLFEEPELYLHPRAQNILFDALALISHRHQVVVTTHSPFFFSADETTTFVKVRKEEHDDLPNPIGVCSEVDLTDMTEKDKFQIISFESSNLAFFSSRIVLVEGDSELIVLPHIAQLLNPHWDFKSTSINLIKISGKGSFRRYKDFFARFGVDVAMVADLDVLVEGFDKLQPSERAAELRANLLQEVDEIIDAENKLPHPDDRLLKEELQRDRVKRLYASIRSARANGDHDTVSDLLEELFVFEAHAKDRYTPRKEKLVREKADLVSRITALRQKSDRDLDRLELFLKEAEAVRTLAVTANSEDMKAFHRKIGSNFSLHRPETESGGCAAPARAVRTNPPVKSQRLSESTVTGNDSLQDSVAIRFDPGRCSPAGVGTTAKRLGKIRREGLPVLRVQFAGPWRLLPPGGGRQEWWR